MVTAATATDRLALYPATGMIRARLNYAAPPESVNTATRTHGAIASRKTRPWRAEAERIGQLLPRNLTPLPPALVRVTLPVPDRQRRDPHNYTGTTVKSIIDGLVRAGWWPDDTADMLTVMDPRLVVLPELRTPTGPTRARALVDVMPMATIVDALAGHAPELAAMFLADG